MTAQMSSWWALCRREWLEHRLVLCWAPLGLLGLYVLAMTVAAVSTNPPSEAMSAIPLRHLLLSLTAPFTWLYLGVAILVLLASLINERKDRTILFWKSMPVTDTQTVLSKLFLVCGVGSVISVSVIICAQGFAVLLLSWYGGEAIAADSSSIWAAAQLGSSAVNWTCGYISQIFWLLPLWGWLLLVSAVARGLTLFWAAAIPAVLVFLEWVLFKSDNIATSILRHVDLRALPTHIREHSGAKLEHNPLVVEVPAYLPQLAELWASSSMWLAILAGCLFIATAIYFRGRNNEL